MLISFKIIIGYSCNLINYLLRYPCYGGIGEVVNTPDCGSGMHGFDPHISPHFRFKRIKPFKYILFLKCPGQGIYKNNLRKGILGILFSWCKYTSQVIDTLLCPILLDT